MKTFFWNKEQLEGSLYRVTWYSDTDGQVEALCSQEARVEGAPEAVEVSLAFVAEELRRQNPELFKEEIPEGMGMDGMFEEVM